MNFIVKKDTAFEKHVQSAIFNWARYVKIKEGVMLFEYMSASANGGSRNLLEAKNLKRTGVSPGFPDICILLPRKNYHGMFLEVKREDKFHVSEKQKEWLKRLNKVGYNAIIGHGFDECKKHIEEYIN